jgi:hypothetical protein
MIFVQATAAYGHASYACSMMDAWIPETCCCGSETVQPVYRQDPCCRETVIEPNVTTPSANADVPREPVAAIVLVAELPLPSPPTPARWTAERVRPAPGHASALYLNTGRLRL